MAPAGVFAAVRKGAPSQSLEEAESLTPSSVTPGDTPAAKAHPSFTLPAVLPASASAVGGVLLGSGGKGDGGGDKGKGSKASTFASPLDVHGARGRPATLVAASAFVFPAGSAYDEACGLLDQVRQVMTISGIVVEVNLLDGHLDANNPTGPPITDHSTVRRVMEEVGGVLLVHSPRVQPYNGCAAVAAAAKSLHYQPKSDPAAATPDHASSQSFDSAFDLANVAALQAYEKNEQLKVGDFVQVWSLRGGCDIASRHTGVSGCVTSVDSVKGTVTFEPFRPVGTPTITLSADSLAPLKPQSDLIEQFRSARATEEALAFFSRNSLIGEGHFVVTHDQFMVILLKAILNVLQGHMADFAGDCIFNSSASGTPPDQDLGHWMFAWFSVKRRVGSTEGSSSRSPPGDGDASSSGPDGSASGGDSGNAEGGGAAAPWAAL